MWDTGGSYHFHNSQVLTLFIRTFMCWSYLCFDVNAQSFSGWRNVAAAMLQMETTGNLYSLLSGTAALGRKYAIQGYKHDPNIRHRPWRKRTHIWVMMRQEKMCIELLFLDCLSCFHHMANQNVLLTHFANCKQGQRAFVGNNENVEGSELVYYSVYH